MKNKSIVFLLIFLTYFLEEQDYAQEKTLRDVLHLYFDNG